MENRASEGFVKTVTRARPGLVTVSPVMEKSEAGILKAHAPQAMKTERNTANNAFVLLMP